MKIKLQSLDINNFKGIKAGIYNFADKTKIYGANAVGKTSIFDAFTWLFFNKDSSGAEKFSIRPLDKDGKTIDDVDIRVTAVIVVDGKDIEFTKIQRQKKNAVTGVIQGNENIFMVDGFTYKEKDFKRRVDQIVNEEVFKLLTSPTYFLSLNWKKQREILTQFVGDISDVTFAEQLGGYDALIPAIKSAPSLEELQKKENGLIKMFKGRLNEFLIRIDELEKLRAKLTGDLEIVDKRVSELRAEQKNAAQDMADIERINYLLEQFIREKMENISGVINSQFDGILFKLFDMQMNGELKECCEMTIDGVPYSSLNTGHRITGGLKIIKALQELYGVYAPVFVDNAEAISKGNLPEMDCQMILLAVDDSRELKVSVE